MKIFQYLLLMVLLCSSHQNRSATVSNHQHLENALQRVKPTPSQNKTAYQANTKDAFIVMGTFLGGVIGIWLVIKFVEKKLREKEERKAKIIDEQLREYEAAFQQEQEELNQKRAKQTKQAQKEADLETKIQRRKKLSEDRLAEKKEQKKILRTAYLICVACKIELEKNLAQEYTEEYTGTLERFEKDLEKLMQEITDLRPIVKEEIAFFTELQNNFDQFTMLTKLEDGYKRRRTIWGEIEYNNLTHKNAWHLDPENDHRFIDKEDKLFEKVLKHTRAEYSKLLKDNPEDQIAKHVEEILEKTLEANKKFKEIKKKIDLLAEKSKFRT